MTKRTLLVWLSIWATLLQGSDIRITSINWPNVQGGSFAYVARWAQKDIAGYFGCTGAYCQNSGQDIYFSILNQNTGYYDAYYGPGAPGASLSGILNYGATTVSTTATASYGSLTLSLGSTTGVLPGQSVSGAGIPVGSFVSAMSGSTVTIGPTANVTTAALSSTPVTFLGGPVEMGGPLAATNCTSCGGGNYFLTLTGGNAGVMPGWTVSAPGFPLNTVVTSVTCTACGTNNVAVSQALPASFSEQVSFIGGNICFSCTQAFKNLVWGSPTATGKSVGACVPSHSGNYVACVVQDLNSTVAGRGLPADIYSAGGLGTGDPGVGADCHIVIFNKSFTAMWQIPDGPSGLNGVPSVTCYSYCNGTAGAYGFTFPGTRYVPINGTRGSWFPQWNANDTIIGFSSIVCFQASDVNCLGSGTNRMIEGTQIELVTWSNPSLSTFASSGATVVSVQFVAPLGQGGVYCSGLSSTAACYPSSYQTMYEFEHWHPTNPSIFTVAAANSTSTANILVVNTNGSVTPLMPPCTQSPPNVNTCQWREHNVWSPDGNWIFALNTDATGYVQYANSPSPGTPEPTATPLYTFPYEEEVSMLDPNGMFGSGIKLTYFNTAGNPEYTGDSACRIAGDSLEISPDGRWLLLGTQMHHQATGTMCNPGGQGTYGYAFAVLGFQPTPVTLSGNVFMGGASLVQ